MYEQYLEEICIPYLKNLIQSTGGEEACVQWIPLNCWHTVLVYTTATCQSWTNHLVHSGICCATAMFILSQEKQIMDSYWTSRTTWQQTGKEKCSEVRARVNVVLVVELAENSFISSALGPQASNYTPSPIWQVYQMCFNISVRSQEGTHDHYQYQSKLHDDAVSLRWTAVFFRDIQVGIWHCLKEEKIPVLAVKSKGLEFLKGNTNTDTFLEMRIRTQVNLLSVFSCVNV